jgi:integrase
MNKNYGNGVIEPRGPNKWRVRYYVGGKRFSVMVYGSRTDARRRLRELLGTADAGEHIAPSRLTLAKWVKQWLLLLRRGEANGVRRRGLVSPRTAEGYQQMLDRYVLPCLGERPIQKLTATEIDQIYIGMEQQGLSPTTVRHTHVALRSCLATCVRKGHLSKNPADAADVPRAAESDVGQALDAEDVRRLLAGFQASVYLPIVTLALATGLRLSELLALRWIDVDLKAMTLTIARAIEHTKEFGRVLKEPKSRRSHRLIKLDADTVTLLLSLRETHLRLWAGVSDTANISLAAIKLPAEALIFPSPPADGRFDFTKLRNGRTVTRECRDRFRKLGFARLRFHDLRTTHSTALLDAGVPLHTVAERIGNSPEVLLKHYAKHTRKADNSTAGVLAELAKSYARGCGSGKDRPLDRP